MCKFDCFSAMCNNPAHNHLPCVYSTEAMHNAVLELLRALDDENHEVFLMLYWGYRSPWWLLDADTIFEPGVFLEGAHPGGTPTLYVRDSVTQGLDQAHYYCQDVPVARQGFAGHLALRLVVEQFHRQTALAGGFCDGHGPRKSLAADLGRLGLALAARVARDGHAVQAREGTTPLLRQQPLHPRQSLEERALRLLLHRRPPGVLLPEQLHVERPRAHACNSIPPGDCPTDVSWDLYRWYPKPAHLTTGSRLWRKQVDLAMRPFEVVLLEAVPKGEKPALDRTFADQPLPAAFSEPSRRVEVKVLRPGEEPSKDAPSIWTVLEPIKANSAAGVTLTPQPDHSLLATGPLPASDTYTITAETELAGVTAIRLDAMTDGSLPRGGPGRAENGNFALMEFRVSAAPKNNPAAAVPVKIKFAKADYSQQSFGGWPIAAAIDGDKKTGWSIDPQEGQPHVAVFELEKPVDYPGGTIFTFTLEQGCREPSPQHLLGRVRLAATTAPGSVPLPAGYGPEPIRVRGRIPPTAAGGVLVVAVELRQGGHAWAPRNTGSLFTAEASVAGRSVAIQPVLGNLTYEVPWQAWRIPVARAGEPRDFELSIRSQLPAEVGREFSAYFLPE